MKASVNVYPQRFVVLHWLLAFLLFVAVGLGWYMVDIPQRTPERAYFFNLHKSVGLVALLFIILLTLQRTRFAPPELPDSLPCWQRKAASWAHTFMYVLLCVSAASGYLGTNFSRWGIDFFGWVQLPSWGPERSDIYQFLKVIHFWSANLLAALIALHVAAVIKHVWHRDAILNRMWFLRDRKTNLDAKD